MQFQRLRIAGFKSFVEPVELRIEPGLTGVVGPNGCGKSNLLEALRWVMGASSAKSLRADGMDEVIFGGSDERPARSHAEVRLEIDNAAGDAPAPWSGEAVIEVSRRIDRGSGSTYRVNGTEARARDVQILFADGSTGANSPSLVRQGQISELIAAKPANRRRLLEEAAGVAGLYSRRQEAGVRLSAAEANLARLDDVLREVEAGVARLRREARQADIYRRRSAHIRLVQLAAHYARWTAAEVAWKSADAEAAASMLASSDAAREAARTMAAALEATAATPQLREEVAIATAGLQPLAIERDRIERELAGSHASLRQLEQDRGRIEVNLERERRLQDEAAASTRRSEDALASAMAAIAGPDPSPGLEARLRVAEIAREAADRDVEDQAGALAAEIARREAAQVRRRGLADRHADASRRRTQTHARLKAARAGLEAARDAVERLARAAPVDVSSFEVALLDCEAKRNRMRERLMLAEQGVEQAEAKLAATREVERALDDRLRRLDAEAAGLVRLAPSESESDGPIMLDRVTTQRGLEDALAAALGDDLEAGMDAAATRFWSDAAASATPPPAWPRGATPLATFVEGPPQLERRLAYTAVVAREDGASLADGLAPGARLVSLQGDLWRWDGLTVRSDAPRPAARRLEQRARLLAIEAEVARFGPDARTARTDAARGAESAHAARFTRVEAREALKIAEAAVAPARATFERLVREADAREIRRAAAVEIHARAAERFEASARELAVDEAELSAATAAMADAEDEPSPSAPDETLRLVARNAAEQARVEEREARRALEQAHRRAEDLRRRLGALRDDGREWERRAREAQARCEDLAAEHARVLAALHVAHQAPLTAASRLRAGDDRIAMAETRRLSACDALSEAEAVAFAADRAARLAETEAVVTRERRTAMLATLGSAETCRRAATKDLEHAAGVSPAELGARLAEEALAIPTDPQALDAHLRALEAERDAPGVVNLRAQDALAEQTARHDAMAADRTDLLGAAAKLRTAVEMLNAEGRDRVLAAFTRTDTAFRDLFATLFDGGHAELRLVESEDALDAGLEIFACPPGKRLSTMSLMSGGEQALTACALIFAVFLAKPSPLCVLDEVDAPLDDANVERFCNLLDEMRRRTTTRFIAITHNPVTMSRMDRLVGVTMAERGVSQMVSVDLARAAAMVDV